MIAIRLVLGLLFNKLFVMAMDPELHLCSDLSIDAAVSADDGIDYIIKGDYYWQFSTSTGISPDFIAKPIGERWPGLNGPIDAAFAIDEGRYRFSTVFLKNNQWFLYKQSILKKNGTTDVWYSFPKYRIQAAFDYRFNKTMERKDYPIIFIYNNDKYLRYSIQDIERPFFVSDGKAFRMGTFFYFLELEQDDTGQTIADYINEVKAMISNKFHLIFFGDKQFCIANVSEPAPQCLKGDHKNLTEFFGCPRNPYPTTTTTSTTSTITTDKYETTDTNTKPKTSEITPKFTENHISVDSIKPEKGTFSSEKNSFISQTLLTSNQFLTGFTIGTTLPINTPISAAAYELNESTKKTDWTLTIALIVVICVICLISFTVIFVAITNHMTNKSISKPTSGEENHIKVMSESPLIQNEKKDDSNGDYLEPQNQSLGYKNDTKLSHTSVNDYPDNNISEDTDADAKTPLFEADQLIQQIKSKDDFQD